MAKKSGFYPNLPRDTKNPKGRRVGSILNSVDVRVPHRKHADALYKPFQTYNPDSINVDYTEFLFTDLQSGTKNPNWRVTIASGGDATSSYSRERFVVTPVNYRAESESVTWLSKGYGTLFGGYLAQQNSQTDIDDIAVGRLKHKLQDKVGNAKLAPPLAESREIGRLVRQINTIGMDAFRALLSVKKDGGKRVIKQAANIWLGLGFGINPLLKDIKSASDSISSYISRDDHRVVVSGTAHQEYHSGYSPTASSEVVTSDASIGFVLYASHKQGIRYVAGVDLKIGAGNNYNVGNHLGLELGQLPSALWELTAFSWVLDYFTTVGSFLDDVFYTLPGTVVYLSKSYKYQSDTWAYPVGFSANCVPTVSGAPGRTIYTLFQRTKQAPVLPTRALRIKTSDEIASHGLTKLLNLASVLIR